MLQLGGKHQDGFRDQHLSPFLASSFSLGWARHSGLEGHTSATLNTVNIWLAVPGPHSNQSRFGLQSGLPPMRRSRTHRYLINDGNYYMSHVTWLLQITWTIINDTFVCIQTGGFKQRLKVIFSPFCILKEATMEHTMITANPGWKTHFEAQDSKQLCVIFCIFAWQRTGFSCTILSKSKPIISAIT